jgi:di/tricarboxylate transporter
MAIAFTVLGLAIVLFLVGRIPLEIVAGGSLLVLYLTDILSLEEILSGFSHPTVMLVGTLFIVGEGLARTGVTAWFGDRLADSSRGSADRLLLITMIGAALLSMVLANAATVAALMPGVVLAAWGIRSSPSKYLLPLAFAATAGGLVTLAGTAPNVVITHALEVAGERPFGFFEFAKIGVPLLIAMIAYMLVAGSRLLPSGRGQRPVDLGREMSQLAAAYSLGGDLFRLRVRIGSPLIGSTLRRSDLGNRYGVWVLEIQSKSSESALDQILPEPMRARLDRLLSGPAVCDPDQSIEFNDVLIVRGPEDAIHRMEMELRVGVLPVDDAGAGLGEMLSQEIGIAELVIAPRSRLVGSVVADEGLSGHEVAVLAARRGDQALSLTHPLQSGDALLVRGAWQAIGALGNAFRDIVIVGQPEAMARQVTRLDIRSAVAVGALVGMIVLMVSGTVPLVIAALLASVAMVASGCLTMPQAYRAVPWSTVALLAGMIPMAAALEHTGGAAWLADALVDVLGPVGPRAVLLGIMLSSSLASQVMGNASTAVLMSPIVLSISIALGVDPHPMMMGLVVGCSTAFMAPLTTAPNVLVMAPGEYRFADYLKVGAPLTALHITIATILIPMLWTLHAS